MFDSSHSTLLIHKFSKARRVRRVTIAWCPSTPHIFRHGGFSATQGGTLPFNFRLGYSQWRCYWRRRGKTYLGSAYFCWHAESAREQKPAGRWWGGRLVVAAPGSGWWGYSVALLTASRKILYTVSNFRIWCSFKKILCLRLSIR